MPPEHNEFHRLVEALLIKYIINADSKINRRLDGIESNLRKIMSTQQEEADKLNELAAQLQKANDEIQKAIQDLKDALASAGNTSPEVDAATAALTAKAQALDDIVPDPVSEPTPAP